MCIYRKAFAFKPISNFLLDTLKWIENLTLIEHYQRLGYLFFIFNLTCWKCVALEENTLSHAFQYYYTSRPSTLFNVFFIGGSVFANKGRTPPPTGYHPHQKNESCRFPSCSTLSTA